MKLYKMEINYSDIDDFMEYTDTYISDNKCELLKIFLKHKKMYDIVSYKIKLVEGNPILVATEMNESYY